MFLVEVGESRTLPEYISEGVGGGIMERDATSQAYGTDRNAPLSEKVLASSQKRCVPAC